ncbi:MAG: signal peptide protein [Mucilaginibacter sp.]|nr:signal peptide protein [Mucilaginibacter sp.]
MKRLLLILLSLVLPFTLMVSCQGSGGGSGVLQARIDSLQNELHSAYKPGTGAIMNTIVQPHHLKLWFAGQHRNWALAEYERQELMGGFEKVRTLHKDKPEAAAVVMIFPAMDAIEKAIREKDDQAFKNNFALLTNTCNTCHQALKYGFNVIKVPANNSFDNQSF